jgi:mono/diheme cytochrome c family protein
VKPVSALFALLALVGIGLVACKPANDNLIRATALYPEGREVFERYNCIRCHNAGEGGYGPRMIGDVNLRDLGYIKMRVIKGKRIGGAQMPGFPTMQKDELENVAGFVRALAGWEQ